MKPVGQKRCSFVVVCSCQTGFHRDRLGGEQRQAQISTAVGGHPKPHWPCASGLQVWKLQTPLTNATPNPTGPVPVVYRFGNYTDPRSYSPIVPT